MTQVLKIERLILAGLLAFSLMVAAYTVGLETTFLIAGGILMLVIGYVAPEVFGSSRGLGL